ncbi:MAG: sigma 54-interacting transcriptional regulator [Desulfobacterales bacterium]|nr:sigma 54-interacting transcriptional regulator [Desulfobacterales bacterium]
MNPFNKNAFFPQFDFSSINFQSVLDHFDEGIIITDAQGYVVYYNATQGIIDDYTLAEVIGRSVTEIYELDENTSMILRCMKKRNAFRNRTFFYRTRKGKVAHTIHSIFPLFDDTGEVNGSICFIKDYSILEKTTPMISVPNFNRDLGNGTRYTFGDIIGESHTLKRAIKTAREAAPSLSPVMLIGETGTGKELFAQSIHNHSNRRNTPYTALNCAAIPETLLESVLFGTVKGAFTGAMDKPGLFEVANGGTLFLDELLAMPITLQAKLLRVLQEKKFCRIGSHKEISVQLKVLSAVNGSPREAVKQGKLRTDLFYRLGVVVVQIPPLRKRLEDIESLTQHFITTLNHAFKTKIQRISPKAMELFMGYDWPGNVRELEHLIEGAMNSAGHLDCIEVEHFTPMFQAFYLQDTPSEERQKKEIDTVPVASIAPVPQPTMTLAEQLCQSECLAIEKALAHCRGVVSQAAQMLGLSRQLLHYKIKKHAIDRSRYKTSA